MPRQRNDPDPLEGMRRKLAEQERLIAEKLARLNESSGQPPVTAPVEIKRTEPPVWRLEDDSSPVRPVDSAPRKRNLARQRQRDRLLFFIAVGVLFVVVGILLWVAYAHTAAPVTGP